MNKINFSFYFKKWKYRMSNAEQIHFVERLSFLVKAAIPLVDSLRMMQQGVRKVQNELLEELIQGVLNGQTLSKSMSKRGIFMRFIIHMIHVGEMSGRLAINLHYIGEELKKRHALGRKMKGALLYPAFITFATFAVTTLLLLYIFPKILPVFKSMKVTLPASTRILLFVNDVIAAHGLLIFFCTVFTLVVLVFLYKKIQKLRTLSHKVLLYLPIFGKVTRSFNVAHFTRTTGLLLQSGIPIGEALTLNADITENLEYQIFLKGMAEHVIKGETISSSIIKKNILFPPIASQMIAVGEKTGSLAESLLYLSDLFEAEVDNFTKTLSTSIEPILMIVMGVIVGFVAISIITPIYEITQNLHQ